VPLSNHHSIFPDAATSLPSSSSVDVFEAVADMYSKDRSVLEADPLHVAQDLILLGYFNYHEPPTLTDVGHAQDLIRDVER
jgi:hypothetical protein